MEFQIGNRTVSPDQNMYVIAEIGVNHNGSLKLAKALVDLAKEAGADAVKFQMYKADNLVTAAGQLADYQKQGNYGTQQQMLQKYEWSRQQFEEMKQYCDQVGITFLATPFDESSARALQEMGVEAFKISSGDLTNYPLLQQIAAYQKPMIISTGMATYQEIEAVLQFLPQQTKIALLHCTSAYPAPDEDLHLQVIHSLQAFGQLIGYSDHSLGLEIPYAVTAMGYKLLEKHFTLDRSLEGPDHRASLTPAEFKQMIAGIRRVEKALGTETKQVTPSENETKQLVRRGIYVNKDLSAGHKIAAEDLQYLRPLTQIEACHYQQVVGRKLSAAKKKGEPLLWQDLEDSCMYRKSCS